IIMANLPPPNNDMNVPENEHAPAPDILNEEPEEEEEPILEQAPAGFAPQWIGGNDPNNNNGWIEKDDEDEVEAEEEDEEEIEDEEDEEMKVKDNDGKNDDAEVYNLFMV
ncbi:hypothetical protein Tco_1441876, partial [Tanacetum coccineum]